MMYYGYQSHCGRLEQITTFYNFFTFLKTECSNKEGGNNMHTGTRVPVVDGPTHPLFVQSSMVKCVT